MSKKKVLIIGTDHVNTLGVIRCFGENGIAPSLIILSDTKLVSVNKSKYVDKYWICKKNDEILELLKNGFNKEKDKIVIIPTSDSLASLIDSNFDQLRDKFIMPNINETQNEIIKNMDKYTQFLLAKKYGFNRPKSKIINFSKESTISFNIYPCILKPIVSFQGKKSDIMICGNQQEFLNSVEIFRKKGYERILVQELIDFDYECDLSGFCYDKESSISGYIHKEHIWPLKKGSFTFGKVKPIQKANKEVNKIKQLMKDINYTGIFDIDFFIKDNKFYFNEINFRNGALGYLYGEAYICYYWYLSCVKEKFIASPMIKKEYYALDEQSEFHNVLERNITLREYINEKKISKYKMANNKLDKKPSRSLLFLKILKNLKIMKIIQLFEK